MVLPYDSPIALALLYFSIAARKHNKHVQVTEEFALAYVSRGNKISPWQESMQQPQYIAQGAGI